MIEDLLSEGYFFKEQIDGTVHIVRGVHHQNSQEEAGYKGIMECYSGNSVGYVIPIDFLKEELNKVSPEKIKTAQQNTRNNPEKLAQIIASTMVHVLPEDDLQYKKYMEAIGKSNAPIIGLFSNRGDCFVKAAIICAHYRIAGLPSRIVGYDRYPQKAWEVICSELNEWYELDPFRPPSEFELDMLSHDYSHRMPFIQVKSDSIRVDKNEWKNFVKQIKGIRLGRFRVPEFKHGWVEVFKDNKWMQYETNRHSHCKLGKLIVERAKPHARVFSELRIEPDKSYRWKDLTL